MIQCRQILGIVVAAAALLLGAAPVRGQDAAPAASVVKTVCLSALDWGELEPLKQELLLRAKREASTELFGELIAATTTVENLVVTTDQIRAQSLGLIRVRGSVTYANGPNMAEVCATLTAYATTEDRAQFAAETISGRSCITEPLTLPELRAKTEIAARLKALIDYDGRLQDFPASAILPLLRRLNFSENHVLADTDTYCATVVGAVIPIEVISFLSLGGAVPTPTEVGATSPDKPATTPVPAAYAATITPMPLRTVSRAQATVTAAPATVVAYQIPTPTPVASEREECITVMDGAVICGIPVPPPSDYLSSSDTSPASASQAATRVCILAENRWFGVPMTICGSTPETP